MGHSKTFFQEVAYGLITVRYEIQGSYGLRKSLFK